MDGESYNITLRREERGGWIYKSVERGARPPLDRAFSNQWPLTHVQILSQIARSESENCFFLWCVIYTACISDGDPTL